MDENVLFRVRDVRKSFSKKRFLLREGKEVYHAVDGVSFDILRGETFGIVGQSGCGKTTLARLLLRLIDPTGGSIVFKGRDITTCTFSQMKPLRRLMQMIFQDPYGSLNPRKSVYEIIAEPYKIHGIADGESLSEKVRSALSLVELPVTNNFLSKLPEALSGGQRQRIGIARALVLSPELVICDEPVSMLDASVKAGVIGLLSSLKQRCGITYIFITHEIGLAYHFCDRIAVMYRGKIVELGSAESVVKAPEHPYTKLLIDSIPPLMPDPEWSGALPQQPEKADPQCDGRGCVFLSRCDRRAAPCREKEPPLAPGREGHAVACHMMGGTEAKT